MKQIKLVSLLVAVSIIILARLGVAPSVSAVSGNEKLLIATPFERGQNLEFFFDNNGTPLEFFEVPDETPIFLSIVTPDQLETYKEKGYKPIIIDQQAGSISQYYIIYGSRFKNNDHYALLQNEVQKNQGLEFAYPVITYTTLVKVAPGRTLAQLNINLKRTHQRQLAIPLNPRFAGRSVQGTASNETVSKPKVTKKVNDSSGFFDALSWIVVITVIAVYAVQVKRAKARKTSV